MVEWHKQEFGVIGEIELLGHVIEGEDGYRSQGAIIRRLQTACTDPEILKALEARYQCDVEIVEEHKQLQTNTFQLFAAAW